MVGVGRGDADGFAGVPESRGETSLLEKVMRNTMLVLAALVLAGTGTAFGVVKNDKGRVISDSPAVAAPAAAVVATEKPSAPAAEKQVGSCCTFSDVTTATTNDKGR